MSIAPQILLVTLLFALSFTKVVADMPAIPAIPPLFVENEQNQPMRAAIPYPVDSNVMSYFSPNNPLFQPNSPPMVQSMPMWNAPNYPVDPNVPFYSMPYPSNLLNAYPSAGIGQQMQAGMTNTVDTMNLGGTPPPNAVPFNGFSNLSTPQAVPANEFPPLDLSVSPKNTTTVQEFDNNTQMYMAAPYYMMPMTFPEALAPAVPIQTIPAVPTPAISTQPLISHDVNKNKIAEVAAKKDEKLIKILQQTISDNITIMGNVFEGKKLLLERITKLENELNQQKQQLTQLDTENETIVKEKNRLLNKAKATLQTNILMMQRFLRSSDQKESIRVKLQDQLTQQQQLYNTTANTTANTNQALIETKNNLLSKAKNTITDNIEAMQNLSQQHQLLTTDVANLNSKINIQAEQNNIQAEQNNTLEEKYQDKIQAFTGLSQQLLGATADDDNDKVVNPSDKCPNTPKGTYVDVSGCPADIDADGITDDIDKCAFTQAGFTTNAKGCEIDTDKDGIVDSKDQCPATSESIKVSATGCEIDDDNDKVPNSKDQCLNTVVGRVVNDKGCEIDSDADGIIDSKDQCADTLNGLNVDPQGCEIDSDHDGIVDSKDQCPATTKDIKVNDKGCVTDNDHDGIIDSEDACLNSVKGAKVDDKGCELDTDKDGIVDSKDQCPMSAKNLHVNDKGCELDSDNDGIVDSKDQCADTGEALTVNNKGCELDSDQDGVLDRLDQCSNTVLGAVIDKVTGCEPDADKDGIADSKDLCPSTTSSTKVNEFGCSADEKITLKGVNFKSASAELTADSLPILDDAAIVLKRHPDIHIEVGGHTDSAGSAAMNKSLSQKRATSVMSYLVKKGISSSKITAKGYGEEVPIADNKTDAGRATNRRVELKITH